LRFFFKVTLRRHDIVEHTHFVHEPRKLPVVLSPEEVARLLDAAPGLKYKAALSVAYGAGLRAGDFWSTLSERTSPAPTGRSQTGHIRTYWRGHQMRQIYFSASTSGAFGKSAAGDSSTCSLRLAAASTTPATKAGSETPLAILSSAAAARRA